VSPSASARKQKIAAGIVLAGALLLCILFVLMTVGPEWMVRWGATPAGNAMLFLPIVEAFALGLFPPGVVGFLAVAAMTASLQIGGFNPLFTAVPMGMWVSGFIIRDRLRLVAELDRAGAELRADSERLAEESVRYEHARIARELHDIVAHCVSVIVIQAYAGERRLTEDPASARAAFERIGEVATQARLEIRRLIDLLGPDEPDTAGRHLSTTLEALVAAARAAGVDIELRLRGDVDGAPEAVTDTAYSVARESLTNALKHAPGGAVGISVERLAAQLRVVVADTGPASAGTSPVELAQLGGGRGIAGMRMRVLGDGGRFTAGRAANGGWRVEAGIPLEARAGPSAIPAGLESQTVLGASAGTE
jgi:signal transduction histidine kinase